MTKPRLTTILQTFSHFYLLNNHRIMYLGKEKVWKHTFTTHQWLILRLLTFIFLSGVCIYICRCVWVCVYWGALQLMFSYVSGYLRGISMILSCRWFVADSPTAFCSDLFGASGCIYACRWSVCVCECVCPYVWANYVCDCASLFMCVTATTFEANL